MKPTVLESKTLATVAYDADHQLLQIEFRDQTTYRYFNVPTDVYETLLRASSKGSYFNRVIRGSPTSVCTLSGWISASYLSAYAVWSSPRLITMYEGQLPLASAACISARNISAVEVS